MVERWGTRHSLAMLLGIGTDMTSSITFKRDDTGESFTFSNRPPYMLAPGTKLPTPGTLSVSGTESMGTNGGTTLASRLERQAVKIVYNVMESYDSDTGIVQLLADASRFFTPMMSDLSVVTYTMTVQTDDKVSEAYMMKKGAITVPFSAPLLRGRGLSVNNELDFIFDDPYRYWIGGSGVISGDIYAALPPGVALGEVWANGLQKFTGGLSQWTYPAGGTAGTPQSINVVSSVQVGVEAIIRGQITNPILRNDTDGSSWQWLGTIPKGSVITLGSDGIARDWTGEIIYNSIGQLTAMPGENTFSLDGENVAGEGYATVTVRGAF